MNGPIIVINAPCAFIRIEVRRSDGEETVIAEVLPADALREFFAVKGPAEWIRKLQENRYDLR